MAGVIAMALIAGVLTDKLEVTAGVPLTKAVIVAFPTATPVATPVVLLMVATLVLSEDQLAWLVISAVEPSA